MEKITTYNYEAFYLDYLEGNLDENEQVMLFDFLDANPTLKSELELDDDILDFSLIKESDSLTRFEKEDLKHFDCKTNEISLSNVNDFMIADVENEISADKKVALNEFVVEHDLQTSQKYFYATKLKADLKEVYHNKKELKKKGTIIPMFAKVASIAAVGLLMFNLLNNSESSSEIYSPRNGEFALGLDSSNHTFDINTNNIGTAQNNYATVNSNSSDNKKVVKEKIDIQEKDSILVPSMNFSPSNNDFVEDKNETNKNDYPIMPLHEEDNGDVALVDHTEKNAEPIKLVDMYQPATNLANNYTNLNVSYQKSVPESDYQVTAFSIGKFSFERKKRK